MSTTNDRWDRIHSVLERALELEPAEVDAYLDRECAGDDALRAEVESLIAADRDAPAFLDRAAFDMPSGPPAAPPLSLEGTRLGAFRVHEGIGRGGMSIVYAGERVDGQFEQRVAIKVLQRDATARGMAERFHIERQILGSLDHRGIVRILDGGTTLDGRPYLVMDYIDGERIDSWCDARRLTIAERLRLFRQVLDAVAYAHRALVVHRDLKPDNIMVTPDGEVRLLDFGIAKLLESDGPGGTPTRTGVRPMTPEYASPEQVRGERITTACDIYALGVLLYELLAGTRPYSVDSTNPFAVERAILESEPDRPSNAIRRTGESAGPSGSTTTAETIAAARRTEPQRLRSTLDGDIDAIVLKTLRKEPEARYSSADALDDDLGRYLDSLPVLARRGTRAYQLRKFVRRHRAGVAIAAAILLLVLGSTAAIAASRVTAQRALATAEREARTAREVTDFLIAVFAGSNPYETLGDSVSARTLLERGRERIDTELENEPVVRASLLEAIGRVYSGLGRYDVADTLMNRAAELRVREFGENDIRVANAYLALGQASNSARSFTSAQRYLERALAIHQALGITDDSAAARLYTAMASSLRDDGQADSALVLIERTLAGDRARGDSTSTAHLVHLMELAVTLRAVEDFETASAVYEDLLPRLRGAVGEDHDLYGTALNNSAYLLTRQGRWADAVPLYRESVDNARRILGPYHPRVVTGMSNLASALYESGSRDEALAVLRERLEATRRSDPDNRWRLGYSHQGIGKMLLYTGRHAEAEAEFRQASTTFVETLGPDHLATRVTDAWGVLAMLLQDHPAAPALIERVIGRLAYVRPQLDSGARADIGRMADQLDKAGRPELAQQFRQLLEPGPG